MAENLPSRVPEQAARTSEPSLSTAFFSIAPLAILIFTVTISKMPMPAAAAGLLQLFILGICWKGYAIVEARKEYALLHPLAAFFISLMLLDGAWIAMTKQKTVWR